MSRKISETPLEREIQALIRVSAMSCAEAFIRVSSVSWVRICGFLPGLEAVIWGDNFNYISKNIVFFHQAL